MATNKREVLLRAIQTRIKVVPADDDRTFDELDSIRSEVKRWDGDGEPPQAARLRELGVEVDGTSDVPPPNQLLLSKSDLDLIENGFRNQLDNASSEEHRGELRRVRQAVKGWAASEQNGPLPFADQLAAWGIWPPAGPELGLPTPDALPEADQPTKPETPPGPDPDDALRPEYDQALALLGNEQYYEAAKRLKSLSLRARAGLLTELERKLTQAETELKNLENRLIAEAEQVSKRYHENFDRQQAAWEKVSDVNPGSARAETELYALSQRRAQREVGRALRDWEKELDRAVKSEDLSAINTMLGEVSGQQIDDSLLTDELQQQRSQFKRTLLEQQRQVRKLLGVASTRVVQEDYLGAYLNARQYVERGTKQIYDESGAFGGGLIETLFFFEKVSELLLDSLRTKADERTRQARSERENNPTLARRTLENALELLNAKGALTQDHANALQPSRETIEHELGLVETAQNRYDQAGQKLVSAQQSDDMTERLNLLAAAAELFPNYPGLREAEDTARSVLASRVSSEVASAILEARLKAEAESFEEALNLISAKREMALRKPVASKAFIESPWPPPGSQLEQTLGALEQAARDITNNQRAYNTMQETLAEADRRIAQGTPEDLEYTANLLAILPKTALEHKRALETQARLATKRGDQANWEEGNRHYRLQQWQSAETALQRVAQGASSQKDEATRLVGRIQAVLQMEAGRAAEDQREWGKALSHYQTAARGFVEHGADEIVQATRDQAEQALKRLEPLEANDRQARKILKQASADYEKLLALSQAREAMRLPDKVRPLSDFANMVAGLEQVAKGMSTLNKEADQLLSDTLELWRKTYVAGMQAALGCENDEILTRALKLAGELHPHGLLYRTEDMRLARDLHLELLDLRYQTLMSAAERDWLAVEDNRKQKLDTLHARPKEVVAELQTAQRGRIRAETNRRERTDAKDAQRYLEGAAEDSLSIRSDPQLIQLLVELCWRNQDWLAAERATRYFGENLPEAGGADLQKIWLDLTKAAQAFAETNPELGRSHIDQLRKGNYSNEQLNLFDAKERELVEGLRERLVREAQAAEKSGLDDKLLEAAEKYALAHSLDPEHEVVKTALGQLGRRLKTGIESRCQEVKGLKIGNRPLAKALEDADKRHQSLTALTSVAGLLGLDDELKAQMELALDGLQKVRETWRNLKSHLDDFDRKLAEAQHIPLPLDRDNSGGWVLDEAESPLRSVEAIARLQQEALRLVEPRRKKYDEAVSTARALTERIEPLMLAVQREEFEQVIEQAEALEKLWQKAASADWAGLETLIGYRYEWATKETNHPREHRDMADKQNKNFIRWNEWAAKTNKHFNELRRAEKALLKKELAELVQDSELKDLLKQCDDALSAHRVLESVLSETPQAEPLSRRAEEARESVSKEAYIEQADDINRRILELKKAAGDRQKKFNDEFKKLNQALAGLKNPPRPGILSPNRSSTPPLGNIQVARTLYQICADLDPLNDQLPRVKDYLDTLPGS